MKPREHAELLLLAALWGGSFLFMRVAAGEFGPLALVALRTGVAAMLLVPLLAWRGGLDEWRGRWHRVVLVGALNSALPFVAFAYAALAITAGLSSIFNATVPLWGALIARAWLGERLGSARAAGLAVGFAGVLALGWRQAGGQGGAVSSAGAIAACLAATAMYGFAAHYTRRRLADVTPLAVAAGSQLASVALLAPLAVLAWPATTPSPQAWGAALLLGLLCTGVAYVLYFRLIASAGAAQAMAVTYLIPLFGVFWGWLALDEPVTAQMGAGGAAILLGTALATGMLAPRRPAAPALTRD